VRRNPLFGEAGTPTVVVVGGGMGGIATGVKLKKAGIDTFTIFEKSSGPGGTWWDNHYPGAEVDVASHMYSFSFMSYDWSRTHVQQPELQQYLADVVDRFGLGPHFRFSTPVKEAVWDDRRHLYTVRLENGEEMLANVVISCLGLLNNPRYPDWPGLNDFEGPTFHTARWEHEHDLTGKRVAVVGTGSTASQVVPTIAPTVGHLYLFQRDPGWVTRKGDRDFSPEERAAFRRPLARRLQRLKIYVALEKLLWRGGMYRPGFKMNTLLHSTCTEFIESTFKDRPDLREAVTPTYPCPGKRIILNDHFYPALLRPNVELVPKAVAGLTKKGVIDTSGEEREIDVLVLATGFQPANFLSTLRIVGRGGRSIHEVWGGEPQAFLGITVRGFPNFFMLYGPNTNGGEIIMHLERQAEFAVRAVKRMIRQNVTSVEVRPKFMETYNRLLQRRIRNTVWEYKANYYKSDSGRIVTQWLDGPLFYGALTKVLGPFSEVTARSDLDGTPLDSDEDGPITAGTRNGTTPSPLRTGPRRS
jgi:cation diffusion facilitator CzcD-associated flavoprotein CzcO